MGCRSWLRQHSKLLKEEREGERSWKREEGRVGWRERQKEGGKEGRRMGGRDELRAENT